MNSMRFSFPLPDSWLVHPPEILVAGNGPYATALALILKAGLIGADSLEKEPAPLPGGAYPMVFDELRIVFLVSGLHHGAAELLAAHSGIWRWVGRLSEEKEEHPLAVIFVLPGETSRIKSSLALALALPEFDPATSGHSTVRMGETLDTLLATASQTIPRDAIILRNRIEADRRHLALSGLWKAANEAGGDDLLRPAAMGVLETFSGQEYDLDLFCRAPHHSNGNALRGVLRQIVTGEVTPLLRENILTRLNINR